ncbi:DUF1716-domain-containing protein [Linderina pennispora]|uniref:DUF1716-domain-containing protein n=1 Tax=Linderina pennispora TaxID=61395 RepID=A0A1Y1W5R6_9FUNG|nr:DUF1716-domain-containing protein [Linderina pennispora]ORX68708.1 DUF1716-domain-containing protein [Linderina pennispora]
MDINDIFKEKVTSTSINSGKRRRLGPPSGRALTPDSDNSAAVSDSEGGRFFSDGLTTKEKGVLSWVDQMEDMDERLDHAAVQRLVLRLEKAVSKNTEDRIKHAESPEGFAESEAELDEAIQRLLMLANSVQYLKTLQELECLPTLVGLMAHENADIALDVIQVVAEVTAEDAWSGESQEERDAVEEFVRALAKEGFFEEGEADRQGVFQTLGLIENLVSLNSELAEAAVAAAKLLVWLTNRISKTYTDDPVDSNQQSAAEILSILLQSSPKICQAATGDMMDALLRCTAKYRKRSPGDETESEYLENIVDSVCMLLTTDQGKRSFVDLEGVELVVLLQKQVVVGKLLSLKILDYALTPGSDSAVPKAIAKRYIDGLGLKYLFSMLMKKGKGDMAKLYKKHPEFEERAVNCIAWLFRLTDRDTPTHWRVLAKFMPSPEDDKGWKLRVDRIVELNAQYAERVAEGSEDDDADDDAEDRYLRRLDVGLFSLQMCDIIVGFAAGEETVKGRIETLLKRRGRNLDMVRRELAEYVAVKQAETLGAADSADSSIGDLDLAHLLERL